MKHKLFISLCLGIVLALLTGCLNDSEPENSPIQIILDKSVYACSSHVNIEFKIGEIDTLWVIRCGYRIVYTMEKMNNGQWKYHKPYLCELETPYGPILIDSIKVFSESSYVNDKGLFRIKVPYSLDGTFSDSLFAIKTFEVK